MPTEEILSVLTELGRQVSELRARVEQLESENGELKAENKGLRELLHQQGSSKSSEVTKFTENCGVA